MLSDLELITKIQQKNCEESIVELINRHTPICHKILHKFDKTLKEMGVDTEEIAQENPTIIYHCAKNYNPEKKSKFSSWLANNVRYNCLNYLYKTKPNLSIEDQDLSDILMNLQSEGTNYKEKKEFIFGILAQMKDPRLEKIIELRYFGDKESKKWKNIAAALDTSYMTVSVLHKKALKFLKSKMNSNFLADFI